jgi:hypothetical protein
LTLQKPALTIVDMDSSGDPPLPLAGFRVLDFTTAELEDLTKAGIAYDKHPEAGQ